MTSSHRSISTHDNILTVGDLPESSRLRRQGAYSRAMPSDVRLRNRTAILNALYAGAAHSRSELARITGMSKVSVSDVITELTDEGLVSEEGFQVAQGPGKPAKMLRFNAAAGIVIAIDLSMPTAMHGVVADLSGSIMARKTVPMPEHAYLDPHVVIEQCTALMELCPVRPLGIAVATPGTVRPDGVVLAAPNLGWHDLALGDILGKALGLPVMVDNDANSAVLAERCFGSGSANMVLVQLARGLGAATLIDDHVVSGVDCAAGEIGHVVVDRCDGDALLVMDDSDARVETESDDAEPRRVSLERRLTASSIERAIARAPDHADEILSSAGTMLGRMLAIAVALTNINDIVISGTVVDDTLVKAVHAELNVRLRSPYTTEVRVRRSNLGGDAAALGGIAQVLRHRLGISLTQHISKHLSDGHASDAAVLVNTIKERRFV